MTGQTHAQCTWAAYTGQSRGTPAFPSSVLTGRMNIRERRPGRKTFRTSIGSIVEMETGRQICGNLNLFFPELFRKEQGWCWVTS